MTNHVIPNVSHQRPNNKREKKTSHQKLIRIATGSLCMPRKIIIFATSKLNVYIRAKNSGVNHARDAVTCYCFVFALYLFLLEI